MCECLTSDRVECVWFFSGEGLIIGMIHHMDFQMICDAEKEIAESPEDFFLTEEVPDGAICASCILSCFSHQPGQMTFPETGQWDFPPYWEFDINVVGFDMDIDGKIVFVKSEEVSSNV